MRALCHFDHNPAQRRALFEPGLRAAGYEVVQRLDNPEPGDALCVWNRMGASHTHARRFEASRATVFVVENGYLGNPWRGERWFAVAQGHHNGAGRWHCGGPQRWAGFGVELKPWRPAGGECVVLAQRMIGEPALRSPSGWAAAACRSTGGRLRRHPGAGPARGPSLEADLARASCVATWSSSAALQALVLGIPAFYSMPDWIGAGAARPLADFADVADRRRGPRRDDDARLAMFERLAWAMWSEVEVQAGLPFEVRA